jgi:hypothetical protein
MAGPQNLLDYLRLLVAPPEHVTDTDLLDRFVQDGDQSAFTALVSRYGPMVKRFTVERQGNSWLKHEKTQDNVTYLGFCGFTAGFLPLTCTVPV